MISVKWFSPLLALAIMTGVHVAGAQTQVTIQHAPPIYLPQTSFWKYALPAVQTSSGDEELDQAYRKYLYGDQLSSRAHLYNVLSRHATTSKQRGVALRAVSLQCLLDMGSVADELLLSSPESDSQDTAALVAELLRESAETASAPAQKPLLSARWNELSGGATEPWQSSWIALFDGYQQYRQGAGAEAAVAWKQLAQSGASEPLLQGLAWLGVARVEGENLRTPGNSQTSSQEALFAVNHAVQVFESAGELRGASQAHLVAGEIDFLVGQGDDAVKQLTAADKPFQDADDKEGWTDLNLIAALGFALTGKPADAEENVLAMEEGLGVLRVAPEQIEALVDFSRRLPGLTGMPDLRSFAAKLTDAREFYRWTRTTADPLLEVISLRILVKTLREGSFWGDASFYDSLQSDLYARYRTILPLPMRIQRAALADYDFLRHTKELEQGGLGIATNEFTPWVDTFLAMKKALRDEQLKNIPGIDLAEAQEAFALFSKTLKDLAREGDAARQAYGEHMAAGDQQAAAQSVADMFAALVRLRDFLNTVDPVTRLIAETENANTEDIEAGKNSYEIHSELVSNYRIEVPNKTKVEMLHEETYFKLLRDVLASATVGDEKYLHRGVRKMVAFYDQYRSLISPAETLDVPFVFQRQADYEGALLPASTEDRARLIAEAVHQLKKQYRQKLLQDIISTDPKAPDLSSSTLDSTARTELSFFNKNWQKDDAGSHIDSNEVNTIDRDGKKVVTIKHSYTATYKVKENSDYSDLPPASSGIDIQSRTRAIRVCRHDLQFPLDTLRFNKILEGFNGAATQDVWLQKYLGVTPEQLSRQATPFSSLIDAGQLALSVQRSDDFLPRPGTHSMDYWKKLVQSDSLTQGLASQFSQITDPNLAKDDDAEESAANLGRSLVSSFSKIDLAQEKASDNDDQNPVRSVLQVGGMAEVLRFRPLFLLLLNDRAGAESAARALQSKASASPEAVLSGMNQPPTKEDGLSLALYFVATGDYNRAIDQLKPLPDAFRNGDASRVFQVEYLLALCYRRVHNPAEEIAAFLAAVGDLEKIRLTLRTRNEAYAIQPLRQLVYEEYLNTLFEHKFYPLMANAMRLYKHSSQLPIFVLQASQDNSEQKRLVKETVSLQDVLSRDDVWQVSDPGALTSLLDIFKLTPENKVDPRQTALSGLNRIADVLVDEIKPPSTAPVTSVSASSGAALTIFYFVGSRALYRVVLNQAGEANARYTKIAENELSDLCAKFRSAIEERKDFLLVSTRLHEILLGELPEMVTTHRLYFSLDGALNFIPFQVLKNGAGGPYLVQDHVLSYLSQVPAPATNAGQMEANQTMLLIGNPDGTLPAAETEANKIAELRELQSGPPLLRSDATLANLRSRLSGANLVHFATHARSNPSYPNFAFLQLANGERLYSIDLGGLPFSGKHIFLSACETRLGQVIPGEDIYGIADAFLADGAASVISTLWRIESDSSALFAQRYYALLIQTHDAATALAMTQREFLSGKQFLDRAGTTVVLDAPLYWAGFNQLAAGVMGN